MLIYASCVIQEGESEDKEQCLDFGWIFSITIGFADIGAEGERELRGAL